jgi:hypothetical protein
MSEGRNNPRLIQHGGITHSRIPVAVEVPDVEQEPVKYNMVGLMHLANQLRNLSKIVEDTSRPVDEYITQSGTTNLPANTPLELLPAFELFSERITAVMVTGPASTAYTLQLGDRIWTLTTAPAGFNLIAPLSLLLTRSDRRVLTSATQGDWTLELMGFADVRY